MYSVAADNECLFNAIAFGIIANKSGINVAKKRYKELARKLRSITSYMYSDKVSKNPKYIEKLSNEYIILHDIRTDVSKDKQIEYANKYIKEMKQKNTWGGHLEIIVLGEYLHRLGFKGIKVFDEKLNLVNGFHSKFKHKNKYPCIKLLLTGISTGGCHFNYLH